MAPEPLVPHQADRRADAGLSFDPHSGQLALGRFQVSVDRSRGNRAVLAAYVELAARGRGQRVAELVEVRQADVDALAMALDLDAADLTAEIQDVLGATRADAQRMVQRLRGSKVLTGIAKAATTAVVAGALTAGCAGPGAGGEARAAVAPVTPGHVTSEPVTGPDGGPVAEDHEGVGLIAPAEVERSDVGLVPPATVDNPADHPADS